MLKPNDLSVDTLAALFDQSTDCVKLLDTNGRVVWMNSNGQNVMEIDDFCAVEGGLWSEFWPEDRRDTIASTMMEGAKSSTHRFRAPCPTAKGTIKWWDVTVSPVGSTTDDHAGFLAISRDISGEQEARIALDLALAEMRRRLGTVFATASSLLHAHAGDSSEGTRAFASDMSGRLDALAAVQTLFDGKSGDVRVGTVLSTLLAPFRATRCEIEIAAVGDTMLSGMEGDSIALVLGELCVRSSRNGAFATGGRLRVQIETPDDRVQLVWVETPVADSVSKAWSDNHGLLLMQRIIAARGDHLQFDLHPESLSVTLNLSANRAA